MADDQEAEQLFVRTVAVPDPGDLPARLPRPDVVAWVHQGAGLVGWGEAARVTLPAGEDRFTAGEKWLRSVFDPAGVDDQVRARGTGPVAFGSFTFDPSSDGSIMIVPRVLLGRDGHGRAWLTSVAAGRAAGRSSGGAVLPEDFPLLAGPTPPDPRPGRQVPRQALRWKEGSLPGPRWMRAVAKAVAAIEAGGLHKVVLARDVFATAAGPIDVRVLLRWLAVRYPDCYAFACDGLVGATPELLISRAGDEVSALVLGGTAPRSDDAAQDEALGAGLLASAKNTMEHRYAVESIRDALRPLCGTLDVDARPALLKYPNLQHLGTRVRGTLAPGGTPKSSVALAAALHPPAAVCGTPAGTALELIRELEHMDRDRYAGPVGWIDTEGNGEWGIALRCAQLSGNTARLFAGCGIVAGSDPAAELAETLVKLQPMRGALES